MATTTKRRIYTAHADLTSFAAARPRGEPVWKSIANDVAVHKRYKKRRGAPVTDAAAYAHLRGVALAKHDVAQACSPLPSPPTTRPTTTSPSAAVPPLRASSTIPRLVVVVPNDTAAPLPLLASPASPSPGCKMHEPDTPRTPSTPGTPAHNPCCVCSRKPAAVVLLPCRDQRLCAGCWSAHVAAKQTVHARNEKLRRELFFGTFVAASFVPPCPTCRQDVASSFVPFTN